MQRALAITLIALNTLGCSPAVTHPGARADGSILLPNSWTLTPAGEQIPVGDLPLGMVLSPDEKYLLVTNNGYADQYVSVIDVSRREEISRIPMKESWLGLTFNTTGDRLYVSAGGNDRIEVYSFEGGNTSHRRTLPIKAPGDEQAYFVSGIALSRDERTLLACALRQNKLALFDLKGSSMPEYIDVGPYPYTAIMTRAADTAYVSNWGGQSVSVVDLAARREVARIAVGDHPNAMVLSHDESQLFVVNASSNELSVIDTARMKVVHTLDLSPYPGAPSSGSTPNGIALSADGRTLYLVNADNNSVSVVDVSAARSTILGSIPTGWYPTAVALTADNKTIFVANGKGLSSRPNIDGPQPTDRGKDSVEYIGRLFLGTVSVLPIPDSARLLNYTDQVSRNNGFSDMAAKLQSGRADMENHAIPRRLGEPSFIKHVFYIIKENRTYDQVLGDLPAGEGDPGLTLFDRKVAPNHHALAESFVLFDNFYVDAEVSMDGHAWSLGAIATDFVEKLWPTNYSGRHFPRPLYFDVAYPFTGYLWDVAAENGVSYRSFGEFIRLGKNGPDTNIEALKGHFSMTYPTLDLTVTDNTRADRFIDELAQMIKDDEVPQLNILQLPDDHTLGTRPGMPSPRSMMADNDLALGRIVAAISNSAIWPQSAIFIIEDDSQNGPDHIDAHRTVALIASPYAKRGMVDHTMYDTVSLLRTLELILGLPPMSQYDAAAVPMYRAFSDRKNLQPFVAQPNTYTLNEINPTDAYGAELSSRMNFAELDFAPEALLNEIIWKSIKGEHSEMPQPHTNRAWSGLSQAPLQLR